MQILEPKTCRADVALFVPRWLPHEWRAQRLSHLLIPVLGALMHANYRVRFFEEAYDGAPTPAWREHLDGAAVAIAWCGEMYPATQIAGLRAFFAAAAGMPLFCGGGFFPLLDPATLELPSAVRGVVTGPGEVVLPALADAIVEGAQLDRVPGIWLCHADGGPRATVSARRRMLDGAWIAPLAQLDLARYLHPERLIFDNDEPALQIHTGSGCAKRCPFCFDEQTPYGVFSAAAVVEAVATVLRRSHVRQIQFGELDFLHKTERACEVAAGLLALPQRIRWFALGSVADVLRLRDEDLAMLARSGCHRLELGTESGSTALLARLGKRHRPDDVFEAVRRLVRHGIRTTHNLLLGVPGEREADRMATLRLARHVLALDPHAHMQLRVYQLLPRSTFGAAAMHMVSWFPKTLAELERYRQELVGGGRSLPWLTPREEEWVHVLVRYVGPMALHRPDPDDSWSRRTLRALARLRCATGIRAGARHEERWFRRTQSCGLAGTFVP